MAIAITQISGIGAKTADIMAGHGFESIESIAGSTIEKISVVPGFGQVRAAAIIAAAKSLLADPAYRSHQVTETATTKKNARKTTARPRTRSSTASGRKAPVNKTKSKPWSGKKAAASVIENKEKARQAKLIKEQRRKENLRKENAINAA